MLSESERKEISELLAKVPLFSSLDKRGLEIVTDSAVKRVYKASETIIERGERATNFFMILGGSVQVRRGNSVLATLTRGDFFGEMALLDKSERVATVIAKEDAACILITSEALEKILDSDPKIMRKLASELIHRLRESDKALTR